MLKIPAWLRYLFTTSLFLSVLACSGATSPSTTPPPTPTMVIHDTAASNAIPGVYEQGVVLFEYQAKTELVLTEQSLRQENDYTVHKLTYPSPKTGNVPAYLVVPEGPGPFAGILLMHGSSGSRETLLPLAEDLVKTGAVVLTISGPAARPEEGSREWLTFTSRDRDDQIQLIVDLRRGVDLLIQQDGVDPSRLGYIGYSYGAAMGGLLAGVEPRIKAYGLMVGDGGLVNHFMEAGRPVGWFQEIAPAAREQWLKAMEPIEPIHYVGHAAPSTLFFQNARFDTSVTEADALAYQAAGSEPKQIQWYDSGHGLPSQAYLDMVDWLAGQIGIDESKFRQTT
jgi:hypothetical protein